MSDGHAISKGSGKLDHGWNGIVSYPKFVYHMGRFGYVYSLLSRLCLRSFAAVV